MRYFSQYEIASLITTVITGALGVYVLLKGDRKVTRLYGIYVLAISCWSFFFFLMISTENQLQSYFWARLLHLPGALIPPTFLHFTQSFLNIENKRSQVLLRRIAYAFGIIFVPASFYPKVVESVVHAVEFPHYYMKPGPYYHSFVLFFLGTIFTVNLLVIRSYFKATPFRKIQVLYLLGSYALGYAGGVAVFLPYYGIKLPAYALYSIPICHIAIAYSILRYRFMDVRLLMRQSSLYLLTAALTGLLISYIGYLFINDIRVVVFIYVVCLTIPFVQSKFSEWVKTEISRRGLLNSEKAKKVASLADRIKGAGYKISDLAQTVVQIIFDDLPVKNCSMFVLDYDTRNYVLEAELGLNGKFLQPIPHDDPLIQILQSQKEILVKSEAEQFMTPQDFSSLSETFGKMGAEVCVPLIVLDQVAGFIAIGPKNDQKPFFENEIKNLKPIIDEAATAMRYVLAVSRAAKETIKFAHTLNQSLKPLGQGVEFLVRRATTNGTDPRLEKVIPLVETTLKKLGGFLNFLLQDSRIADEALRDKYELLPIKIGVVVDDGLSSYDISIKEKRINLSKELLDLEKIQILGHYRDLKSVFEILVNNALRYTPIGGKIEVKGQVKDSNYRIEFANEGDTIPEENLKDIFMEGFQIKNGRQGTAGIGLSNAFKILKMHKGNIFAENSRNPVGARFILDLPLVSANVERGQISV